MVFSYFQQPAEEQSGCRPKSDEARQAPGLLDRESKRFSETARQVRQPKGSQFDAGSNGDLGENQDERHGSEDEQYLTGRQGTEPVRDVETEKLQDLVDEHCDAQQDRNQRHGVSPGVVRE